MRRRGVHSHRNNPTCIANFAVAFQICAGVDDANIIADAGNAKLKIGNEFTRTIRPCKGVYVFNIYDDEEGTLEIFGVTFHVQRKAFYNVGATPNIPQDSIAAWDGTLSPLGELRGVQQRLYMLGYLNSFSQNMNQETEIALLNFQADEGSIEINGDVQDNATLAALDNYFSDHILDSPVNLEDKEGNPVPLLRKYLLRIGRERNGTTQLYSPHPDTRGTLSLPLVTYECVSSNRTASEQLRFGAFPTGILPISPIFPVVTQGQECIEVEHETVMGTLVILKRLSGQTCEDGLVELRYGANDGPVLSKIAVKVFEKKELNVVVHKVINNTLTDTSGISSWTDADLTAIFEKVNLIWASAGIRISYTFAENLTIIGKRLNCLTFFYLDELTPAQERTLTAAQQAIHTQNQNDVQSGNSEYRAIKSANNEDTIDMFLVNDACDETLNLSQTLDIDHNTLGSANYSKRFTIIPRRAESVDNLAKTIAHEIGHVILPLKTAATLNTADRHTASHSDEVPNSHGRLFRSDVWSRSRLMATYLRYALVPSSPTSSVVDRNWQNGLYQTNSNGKIYSGVFLTGKNVEVINSSEITDNEIEKSRKESDQIIRGRTRL